MQMTPGMLYIPTSFEEIQTEAKAIPSVPAEGMNTPWVQLSLDSQGSEWEMVAVNTPMVGRASVTTDALLHTREASTSKKIDLISFAAHVTNCQLWDWVYFSFRV